SHGQTFVDPLGRFLGKPAIEYSLFQLDYYGRGWDRAPSWLNQQFPGKPPIREGVKTCVIDRKLCIQFEEGKAILTPLLHHLDLDDHAHLVAARRRALWESAHYLTGLNELAPANASEAISRLVTMLMITHLTHPVVAHYERLQNEQVRYLNKESLETFK